MRQTERSVHTAHLCTEWPKISENMRHLRLRDCRFNAFKLYLVILLMTSHDVVMYVLFNNVIIFVLLFGKTAKLLLSIMIGSKKQKTV